MRWPSASIKLAIAAALVMPGCIVYHAEAVRGSGNIQTEQRDVGPFQQLEVLGAANVLVTIADQLSLSVEADDNIVSLIATELRGDRLIVSSKDSFSSRHGVKVRVTTPTLAGVRLAGSGDVGVDGLDGTDLTVIVQGSGDVTLVGHAGRLEARVQGSGDIDASGMIARDVDAAIQGSGDIDVHAVESFEGTIQGSGDITYRGDPEVVRADTSGSGRITRR